MSEKYLLTDSSTATIWVSLRMKYYLLLVILSVFKDPKLLTMDSLLAWSDDT